MKPQKILFSQVVQRFQSKKVPHSKILSDEEALYVIKNMTPTSKKYLRMKLDETKKENIEDIPTDEFKIFRDNILAEICAIELNDPRIRKSHNMEPIQ